ncbi:hypothetical protein TL16_g07021 [Triparma laevis f. inornata]|uniref:Apoptosis-antagonizing transcription factor C-terminal domain-containing protein n=1 Tax=Triparma laevis f. inornata TaxID=1714386 RepID=A0A9W7EGX5_9STRA|nr:hypothetical protein TL16_g07021 [Triparma laevis f. inornata]
MSSLITATSSPSQILQSLTTVHHNTHLSDLIALRVNLQRVTAPASDATSDAPSDPSNDTSRQLLLQSLLSKLKSISALNKLPPSRLNDTLTRRQRLTTISHGGTSISTSFMSQVIADASSLPPSLPYDDSKLYKHLVMSWSKSRNVKIEKSKKVKKVDRKASKGRKVKYSKMVKLENFMFPVERGGGEDEWKRSMFK